MSVCGLAEELDSDRLVDDDGSPTLGDSFVKQAGGLHSLGLTERDIEKVGQPSQPIGEVVRFFNFLPYPRRSQSVDELADRQIAQACVYLDFHVPFLNLVESEDLNLESGLVTFSPLTVSSPDGTVPACINHIITISTNLKSTLKKL